MAKEGFIEDFEGNSKSAHKYSKHVKRFRRFANVLIRFEVTAVDGQNRSNYSTFRSNTANNGKYKCD